MTQRFDLSDPDQKEAGLAAAALAVQRGQLVAMPTDTVYGVGVDAFSPKAVSALLAAKRRGREMPPPVLISAATTLDALAVGVPTYARELVKRLWPGPLTLVCTQQSSLQWDLGDTRGTVAVRMPNHADTLELLARTGPMAVSSANRSGLPAATDADGVEEMLGDTIEVLLDGGPTPGDVPSTIVDVTTETGRLLRAGAISLEDLNSALWSMGGEVVDEG